MPVMLGLIIEKKNILDNTGISYDIFSLRDRSGAVTVPSEMFHGIPWARETRHKHCVVLDLHLQGLRLGRGRRRRHNILALFMQPLIHQVLELTMYIIL